MTPHRGANHPEICRLRETNPYQVELPDWLERVAAAGPGLLIEMTKGTSASSWVDHQGARTFGFRDKEQAQAFREAFGGDLKHYTGDGTL